MSSNRDGRWFKGFIFWTSQCYFVAMHRFLMISALHSNTYVCMGLSGGRLFGELLRSPFGKYVNFPFMMQCLLQLLSLCFFHPLKSYRDIQFSLFFLFMWFSKKKSYLSLSLKLSKVLLNYAIMKVHFFFFVKKIIWVPYNPQFHTGFSCLSVA